MGDELGWVRGLIEEMPQECKAWRKFGIALAVIAGAFAFMVWSTVRTHPEQDLPLWPAWIFAALSCVGLLFTAAAVLRLPPFRASQSRRDN